MKVVSNLGNKIHKTKLTCIIFEKFFCLSCFNEFYYKNLSLSLTNLVCTWLLRKTYISKILSKKQK